MSKQQGGGSAEECYWQPSIIDIRKIITFFLYLRDEIRPFNQRAVGTNTDLFCTVFRRVKVTGQVSQS